MSGLTRAPGRHTAALLVLAALAPMGARAQDEGAPSPKRTEGRYFIELAEIMLTPQQFDMEMGTLTKAGGETRALRAEMSTPEAEAPMFTIGLNRPSGKTQLLLSVFDFDRRDRRAPQNLLTEDQVVTSTLLPPGFVFRRQRNDSTGGVTTDYVPNYGTELQFIRRLDFRTAAFQVHHNLLENESFRLRWIAGIRYAELTNRAVARMGLAREVDGNEQANIQDEFSVLGQVETHGLGPCGGLDGRLLFGERKRWSFEGRGEIAFLPESTSVNYQIRAVDVYRQRLSFTDPMGNVTTIDTVDAQAPIMPGISSSQVPFTAVTRQTDFTDMTYLATAQAGFRYKAADFFTVGIDLWHSRYMNVLDLDGVFDTVHREATFEQPIPTPGTNDPELSDIENIIHVPRYSRREDYLFDGVSVNLRFDF